jgi:hypothetical protein
MFKLDRTDLSQNLPRILTTLRTKAIRSGIWFASLTYEDRVLASMISRHIKIVRNAMLATVIARIMSKLFHALRDCPYTMRIEALGRPLAKIYSELAFSLGNVDAKKWAEDNNYARYLGMSEMARSMARFLTENAGAAQ